MATTIDSLQLEIQSNSTNAADSIDSLAKALKKLNKNGSINDAVNGLNDLRKSLHAFVNMPSNASKIDSLAKSLKSLNKIGKIKIGESISSVKQSVESLGAINVDSVAPQIERIAGALGPLSNVNGNGFNGMMNGLKKLGDVADSLDDETITRFVNQVKKLDEELGPLSTKMYAIGTAFKAANDSSLSAGGGFSIFGKKVNTTTLNLQSMISVAKSAVAALQPVIKLLKKTISAALEWDGISARFGSGFGERADEVYSWVKRLNEEMGINTQQFMQYSSVYATMLEGYGVSAKDAAEMALGYTELTYDIWARYNDIYKSYEDAAVAVRAAIAGETEPIQKAGLDVRDSALKQTAALNGLTYSTQNTTNAQKSYLRYLSLVREAQDQGLVGAYAAEMDSAEGLIRTFRQQLTSLAQTFGSVFLPALVKVMPWVNAFVDLMNDAVLAMARFFGVDIQPVDFSSARKSAGGYADALDSATESAKELKNATLGIDELNVISPPSNTSNSGGGSAWDGLDVESLWNESILGKIQFEVEEIKSKLKEALFGIEALISGFALAVGTMLTVTGANIPVGLGLMAVGAVGIVAAVAPNWNAMSEKLAKTLTTVTSVLSGFLFAIGAVLAFGGVNVPLGIGLMVAGAASLATSATINWKFLNGDLENTLSNITGVVSGGLLALGALFAFTGVGVGLGIALMVAGAVGLAATVALNWDSMPTKMKGIVSKLTEIVSTGAIAVGAILAFSGVNIPVGMALMAAGALGLVAAGQLNWDSASGKTKKQIDTIVKFASSAALGVGAVLAFSGVNLPLGIALMASGAVGLASTSTINWDAIKTTISNAINNIANWLKTYGLLVLGVILCFTGNVPLGAVLIKNSLGKSTPSGSTISDELFRAIKEKWSSIKSWWDRNVKFTIPSLSFNVTYTTSGLGTLKKAIVNALNLPGWPKLSFAKDGGMFDMGSLIWAGEAGAEIVANAGGGKTGVMNIQQMQEAVYEGVYSAVVSAMRASAGGGGAQEINVYLDGRQLTSAVEKRQRERGATITRNGVYAY